MKTNSQLTIEDKLVAWLTFERRRIVRSHDLEDRFRPWMIKFYGRKGCLSIHRAWRQMRADGVFVTRPVDGEAEDGAWEILEYRGRPWSV